MNMEFFVEGIADEKFLSDYLKHINKFDDYKIINVNGKDNLYKEEYINILKQNTADNTNNLVVFDADDNNFDDTKQKLANWKKTNDLSFELFLFPNNKEDGNLETLLENIAVDKYKIFECWQGYETCLNGKKAETKERKLITPNKKAKIFAYLETLGEKTKEKDRIYFNNNEIWNLNNKYLNPLKEFLETHLQ